MSLHDDDAEILAAARAGYLEEAQEMLRQYEAALLILENEPSDSEQLNAAFRAAHTIKGGAGMFGFEDVVRFTHDVETLLDALRDGQRTLDAECMDVLLLSRDQIESLLAAIDQGGETEPTVLERSHALSARLQVLMGRPAPAVPAPAAASPAAAPEPAPSGPACWHLSLRFLQDALRNGLDPLAFLRYLEQLGTVHALHLMHAEVPALDALDAEACYLWVELRFETTKGRSEIESVFEFALEDSDVQIFEPGTPPAAFESLAERRCGLDAEKRALLFEIWHDMGVRFEVVETVVATLEAEEAVIPRIERRAEGAPREKGPDRRSGEGDRRSSPRDRRTGEDTRFIRVRADKLDTLIDLIGELVIAGSGAQMVAHQGGDSLAIEASARVMALMQDTRDAALGLRMVPVGETFGRFQRVVRDVAKQLGKEIELVVTGGDTEMDKSMVDAIADPLMHLVRNSMDHGLELPDDREAAGKPRAGTLKLNAFHEAGSIVIEVADDGRGLSRDRILNKAIERELVAADAVLSDAEVWQLIFQPGFSTAEQVTDLSGRGVGMDVVKRGIESLRGHIHLSSTPGNGTRTQIRLPLTLAMIDGFLTQVGEVHYVLPLSVVSECIDVPPEAERQLAQNPTQVSGTFNLRGEIVPWLDLARFYRSPSDTSRRRSVLVAREGQQSRVGLIVDRLLGEHQTVIKPLSGLFTHVKALAGSTILGSGDVALVLDIQGLMEAARRHGAAARH
ncbi:chemotaxis protein CheA [Inhella gelatinilytica]|uniref:Chemotaxis protein CheA n=1 Tax=Inhella gelatinilytica TaxID=2795030 RepID=A0A931ISZ6_9BURK|nr:chemotaxis protein CheA [Inhella gelatinilytica]MBH9552160.1 chemotaxis protein CheA [Inhella gelatinilytica]